MLMAALTPSALQGGWLPKKAESDRFEFRAAAEFRRDPRILLRKELFFHES